MNRIAIALIIAGLAVCATVASAASVPASLSYQGKLTDASGGPVTGSRSMTFTLYDDSGTVLSSDTHNVNVVNGLFTTAIAISDRAILDGKPVMLGIKVGADPEMMPRQSLHPVPYAFGLVPWAVGSSFTTRSAGTNSMPKIAVNVSAPFSNNLGVLSSITSANSVGFYALGAGANSAGLVVNFEAGDSCTGIGIGTHGINSDGMRISTYYRESEGVNITTEGDSSHGVKVLTKGGTAQGVTIETNGINSEGLFSWTIGDNSEGIYSHTGGKNAQALSAHTTGSDSVGVLVDTTGTNSPGILSVAHGSNSPAIRAITDNRADAQPIGIIGEARNNNGVGVLAQGKTGLKAVAMQSGTGIVAYKGSTGGLAADFYGNVRICKYLGVDTPSNAVMELGEGLDYAEGFNLSEPAEVTPGTVLVIDPDNPGELRTSSEPYDRKVAGIISGAGNLDSAIKVGGEQFDENVALAGRVYCNVDATYGAIEVGDLLTTSATPGHAMVVTDHDAAQGAILGKAMEPLAEGQKGQILVLVTLQ